jgi:tetratricopeptide (TPR) repeat protein
VFSSSMLHLPTGLFRSLFVGLNRSDIRALDEPCISTATVKAKVGYARIMRLWPALFLASSCASFAVAIAPKKEAKADVSADAKTLNDDFWAAFHAGRYEAIDELLERHKRLYLTTPTDPVLAHHTGFLHMWRVAESARSPALSASVTDDLSMAKTYFGQAVALDPKNALVRGFWATTVLSEGAIHQDQGQIRKGYFDLQEAVDMWPELNLFTKAFVLARTKYDSPQYAEAVETFWKNSEVCGSGPLDRQKPDFSAFVKPDPSDPKKAICFNTWKAPFNFEGSMVVFGDLLVKQGHVAVAKQVYAAARLSPRYAEWPYREVLERRVANAEANVIPFRAEKQMELPAADRFITNAAFSCTVCHQNTGAHALQTTTSSR